MSREYHQTVYTPPEGAADLLLIRHGRTEAARPGESFPMLDGHGDPALHPEGEEQAVLVGERLKNDPISAIYVTTLRRTHQTAAPLAAHLGLTPKARPSSSAPSSGRNGARSPMPRPRRNCMRGSAPVCCVLRRRIRTSGWRSSCMAASWVPPWHLRAARRRSTSTGPTMARSPGW